MKKLTILFFALLLFGSTWAQSLLNSREPEIRHSKGMYGFNLGYYFDKYGNSYEVGLSYNLKNNQMISGNLSYWKGKIKLSDYKDYHIDLAWVYTFYNIKSRFFSNLGLGIYSEYEDVSNYEFLLRRTYMLYGFMGYLQEEIYLFQGLYLTGKIVQYYNMKTNAKLSYGIGLKYNF